MRKQLIAIVAVVGIGLVGGSQFLGKPPEASPGHALNNHQAAGTYAAFVQRMMQSKTLTAEEKQQLKDAYLQLDSLFGKLADLHSQEEASSETIASVELEIAQIESRIHTIEQKWLQEIEVEAPGIFVR